MIYVKVPRFSAARRIIVLLGRKDLRATSFATRSPCGYNCRMISPERSSVRPRVILPETNDTIPLEDLLQEFQGRPIRTSPSLRGDPV